MLCAALAAASLLAVGVGTSQELRWTPDGLFYQARSLEFRGVDHQQALRDVFGGPLGAPVRLEDPDRAGDPAWVTFNAQFYERRIAVPLAAAALEPVSGDRALFDVSRAGHVATILAVFALLLVLGFRLPVAFGIALVTAFLPVLTEHAALPLTDSWGLALMTLALIAAALVLQRGPPWLVLWMAALLLLSLVRDSAGVVVLATLILTLILRSRVALALLATGVVAALPVLLLVPVPYQELLAAMLNDAQPVQDPTWGFILDRYPGALVDLLQANGGFVRDGAWFSALYLLVGLALLFVLTHGRGADAPALLLLKCAAAAGVVYVLAVPIFSALRIEMAFVPMAACGLALGAEWMLSRMAMPAGRPESPREAPSARVGAT